MKIRASTLKEGFEVRQFHLINIYMRSLRRSVIGQFLAALRILRCLLKYRAGFPQYIQYGEDLRLFV